MGSVSRCPRRIIDEGFAAQLWLMQVAKRKLRPFNQDLTNRPDRDEAVLIVRIDKPQVGAVDKFLTFVHIKNPILDAATIKDYARRVSEDGPGWDAPAWLVVSRSLCLLA